MRFRLGAMIGFGSGYYLGSKAGRERYVQLNRLLRKVKRSDTVDTATDKAKAAVDLTVERAKQIVDNRRHKDEAQDVDLTAEPEWPYANP